MYGVSLLLHRPQFALAIIGAVFLAVTGGEALYADMGHFGKDPVRIAWFAIVWPALIINYFGQGALLLRPAMPSSIPSTSWCRRRCCLGWWCSPRRRR